MRPWLEDIIAAFMLLTRLPVGCLYRFEDAPDLSRSVWAHPLVGLTVGALGALGYLAGVYLTGSTLIAALTALALTVLATGAFHEDGLADAADGLGGGRDRDQKLEIMRDSRIGSYGGIALFFSLAFRFAALASLVHPGVAVIALLVSHSVARGALIGILLSAPPARPDSLSTAAGRPRRSIAARGLLLSAAIPLLLTPFIEAAILLGLAALGVLVMRTIMKRQVGGYCGDLLGATEQVVECLVLIGFVALT